MASDNQPPTLLNIPLEVRHQIFEYVAVRDAQPKKLLRYWFEKKEVKEKTAELKAKDPRVEKPRVVFEGDQYEHEELEEDGGADEEGEEDSDAEGEEDSDDGNEEDEVEGDSDGEGEEEGDQDDEDGADENNLNAEEQDAEMDETDNTVVPAPPAPAAPINTQVTAASTSTSSDQTSAGASQDDARQVHCLTEATPAANDAAMAAAQASMTTASATAPTSLQAPAQANTEDEAANESVDEAQQDSVDKTIEEDDIDEEEDPVDNGNDDEEGDEEGGNEDGNGESDEEMDEEEGDAGTVTGAAQPHPTPAPVITAHSKWRHIPQFMRITHCPPPVELLLTSKQLNEEAKSWFYDVTVLRIDATGSFAHTSFFEEAFSQITEAAFSPMEDIRKVEVAFVWDTTWLRSDQAGYAAAIFPALLRQRAAFVVGILAQAPNLSNVTIHWHDSAKDDESVDLMNDVLMGFLGLNASIKVEPHYIAADAKPYRKSIAGRRRVEFQNIVDNGLDRLF